jgi:hypothetical protein
LQRALEEEDEVDVLGEIRAALQSPG